MQKLEYLYVHGSISNTNQNEKAKAGKKQNSTGKISHNLINIRDSQSINYIQELLTDHNLKDKFYHNFLSLRTVRSLHSVDPNQTATSSQTKSTLLVYGVFSKIKGRNPEDF